MNKNEKILYDFFVTIMKTKPDVSFPIAILTVWEEEASGIRNDGSAMDHPQKGEILNAWYKTGASVDLNKVIYEAIKTIRKLKASEENG